MSDKPINLNRVRKARARDAAKRKADENALRFGRTKAERTRDETETKQTVTRLDAHRRDDGE